MHKEKKLSIQEVNWRRRKMEKELELENKLSIQEINDRLNKTNKTLDKNFIMINDEEGYTFCHNDVKVFKKMNYQFVESVLKFFEDDKDEDVLKVINVWSSKKTPNNMEEKE